MVAFLLGLAGSSFAIGVGYVSRWTPPRPPGQRARRLRPGQHRPIGGRVSRARCWRRALGMAAVFHAGWRCCCWCGPRRSSRWRATPAAPVAQRRRLRRHGRVLTREKLAWLLAAFYFLTFGGFVAFSIYLPTLLQDQFHLAPADAGFRTAGFVVLATLLRPLGGWLSDRIGGARVLLGVFLGVVPFALLLAWPSMLPVHRRRARLRRAAGPGQRRGLQAGAAVLSRPRPAPSPGLVGAMGGLGGFFPPLLLGVLPRPHWAPSGRASSCSPRPSLALWWAQPPRLPPAAGGARAGAAADLRRTADRLRAGAWATLWTALLVAAIVVGSRNLQNFDPALVIYTFAVIFATLGRRLSLQRLAREAAHARLLGPRLGAVPPPRRAAQPGPRCSALAGDAPGRADLHRAAARACAGGCTSACSGAACWPSRSPSRWSSAGSTSAPLPSDQIDLRHLPVRLPGRRVPPPHRRCLAALPRSRHRRRPGARRHRALAVAAHARRRAPAAAAVRHGLPAAHPAVRHLGHRPGPDRFAGVAARRRVQFPGDPARDHGDRRAAVSCRSASSSTSSSGRRSSA